MKLRSKLGIAVVAVMVMGMIGGTVAIYAAPSQHAKAINFQTGPGVDADGSTVNGSNAKLTRGVGEVWYSISTKNLPAGDYTNWWIIWNDPTKCAGGCGEDDLGIEGNAVFRATGGAVGPNGRGKFSAWLPEGFEPAPVGGAVNSTVVVSNGGAGLTNAQGAEIHVVIRYHGPHVANALQTSTLGGGCSVASTFPDSGPPGDAFGCYDPQAVPFPLP